VKAEKPEKPGKNLIGKRSRDDVAKKQPKDQAKKDAKKEPKPTKVQKKEEKAPKD
jgi:hypothetical protein